MTRIRCITYGFAFEVFFVEDGVRAWLCGSAFVAWKERVGGQGKVKLTVRVDAPKAACLKTSFIRSWLRLYRVSASDRVEMLSRSSA